MERVEGAVSTWRLWRLSGARLITNYHPSDCLGKSIPTDQVIISGIVDGYREFVINRIAIE